RSLSFVLRGRCVVLGLTEMETPTQASAITSLAFTHKEDNWKTEIPLLVEEAKKLPWDGIRDVEQRDQALCSIIIIMEQREQRDESSGE
ncbi:hypothetical protein KI387_020357, partial [Taxus chinensis]